MSKDLMAKYGSWAVITGASAGIGRAFAIRLAQAGFNLVLIARRQRLLDELAADLSVQHGIQTRILAIDLSGQDSTDIVASGTLGLDIGLLVAAAGFGTSGRMIDASLESEIAMLHVNCRSLLGLTFVFGQRFARQHKGGIILLSSIVARQGNPYAAHYAATKAYVQTLAEGLRVELARAGVDVIASAPGPVRSGFAEVAGMVMSAAVAPDDVARATLRSLGHRTTVVPGALSKLLTWSLAPWPRALRIRIMGEVMRRMTKSRRR